MWGKVVLRENQNLGWGELQNMDITWGSECEDTWVLVPALYRSQ